MKSAIAVYFISRPSTVMIPSLLRGSVASSLSTFSRSRFFASSLGVSLVASLMSCWDAVGDPEYFGIALVGQPPVCEPGSPQPESKTRSLRRMRLSLVAHGVWAAFGWYEACNSLAMAKYANGVTASDLSLVEMANGAADSPAAGDFAPAVAPAEGTPSTDR